LVFAQDVVAVPESPVGGGSVPDGGGAIRQCVCAPGSMTVDPAGDVFIAYSHQLGMAVAKSTDQGLTWTQSFVPHTTTGSAFDLDYLFQTIRSDRDGNIYLVWSAGPPTGPIKIYFSYLPAGATTWHEPIAVSTTQEAVFGTLATFPNRSNAVDIAYYGTDEFTGVPASAPASTKWHLYVAQSTDPLGDAPFATKVALADVHEGAIETGGVGSAGDRSLGDFFGMVVDEDGLAEIATAVGNAASGTTIHFVRQTSADAMSSKVAGSTTAKAPTIARETGRNRDDAPATQNDRRGGDGGSARGGRGTRATHTPPALPASRPFEGAAILFSLPRDPPGSPSLLPLIVLSACFAFGGGLAYRLKRR
jgi:hypothetical protein